MSDYSYAVAGDYRLIKTNPDEVAVVPKGHWDEKTPKIPSKVIEIGWDDRFVIAKQERMPKLDANDRVGGPVMDQFGYWILDAKTPEVYGPMLYEDFGLKRRELQVPASIQLDQQETT
jgi:hypothetical protein